MSELANETFLLCNQEQCPLKENGFCLEGLAVEKCPHTFLADINHPSNTTIPFEKLEELVYQETEHEVKKNVPIYSGDELSDNEIEIITNRYSTNLILIMGEPNSGKTTLLASLYDQFQKGKFSGYLFAGSKTQIGFEKRCHHARTLSGNLIPNTERTSSSTFHYLHLSVKNEEKDSSIKHLLFTDISGEQFRLIRDHEGEMTKMNILKRADHIFCIADGELFSDNEKRHSAKYNLIKLIGRAYETGMITSPKGIYIIITKWDKLNTSSTTVDIENFLIKPIKDKFPFLIKDVLKIASRSMISSIKSGTGLDRFLKASLENYITSTTENLKGSYSNMREFMNFKYLKND
jgi:GTPase SAR1 family protein